MERRVATVYPGNVLLEHGGLDVITPDQALTLHALFCERARRSPHKIAYREHDGRSWREYTWFAMALEVRRWRAAMQREALKKGDRVALQIHNCRYWVLFEQAALSLGLVPVPLYVADRPDNCNYVIDHSDARLLLLHRLGDWQELDRAEGETRKLERVVLLEDCDQQDHLVRNMSEWLPESGAQYAVPDFDPDELATIVYTSGTTGRPKGVMLSHKNIVYNAFSCVRSVMVSPADSLVSFLPLSHTLERTVGYYVPMMAGAEVAFNRSIPQLREDLEEIRPSGLITVPRIFERVYAKISSGLEHGPGWKRRVFGAAVDTGWARFEYHQGRGNWRPGFLLWPLLDLLVAKRVRRGFGGCLRIAISGGAPLPFQVGRFFNAMGISVLQGYGLTETSPVISTNTPEKNRPETIGLPMHDVEVCIGDDDELLVRGPNIMLGYWKDDTATREAFTDDGWLRSGDQARIDEGFLIITGRLKDILVLANGEKISPADMESAISEDPLFDHTMVIGEQMPYLSALVVLNPEAWKKTAASLNIDSGDEKALFDEAVEKALLERVRRRTGEFPGYARIRRVGAILEPWTVQTGILTPTLKVKRAKVLATYRDQVDRLYAGHAVYRNQST